MVVLAEAAGGPAAAAAAVTTTTAASSAMVLAVTGDVAVPATAAAQTMVRELVPQVDLTRGR